MFSPITKYQIVSALYYLYLRDLIVDKIKNDEQYIKLLEITDSMFQISAAAKKMDKGGMEKWVSSIQSRI